MQSVVPTFNVIVAPGGYHVYAPTWRGPRADADPSVWHVREKLL